jgi:hypothetical protein
MPRTLITPIQIEQASLRLSCGLEYGSGFFISKTHILTARHVVLDAIEDGEEILAFPAVHENGQAPIVCRLLADGGEDLDVALLEIPEQDGIFTLPLFSGQVRYNAPWETFGYPFAHQISGNRYYGLVKKTNIDKPYDVELIDELSDNQVDYRGISGAAMVIENEVMGILTYNILDGFGALSIARVAQFLENNNIPFHQPADLDDLPENLKEELKATVPNGETLAILDEKLSQGGKYYLLHGSPGSGKTMVSAAFNFSDSRRVIAGRYFIRLPNDQRALSYRVSPEAFLEWMEDLISQKLTGSVYPRQTESWGQRVNKFQQLLAALNEYYREKNQIGYFILDGLDDVRAYSENGLNEFFGLFPEQLPSNLSFLLSIIRKDSLPTGVQPEIGPEQEVKVTALDIDQCAFYLHDQLKDFQPEISFRSLQQIAEKSEGHPLYLRYLTEQLRNNRPEDLPDWIEQLPTIGGDIAKYYERIWLSDFAQDQEKFWIALVVSQLRQPVATDVLLQILPENARMAFTSKFPAIRHLFKVNGKTGIYHSSFALFIERKSEGLLAAAHDHIASFCRDQISDHYSITNIVYHLLRGSQPEPAVLRCDQHWADACAKISVEPELVLGDIAKVELFCLDQGDVTGLVRIKLLMQRIRFRYDNVLAANASAIANVLLAMGNPADALKYMVRYSALLVSDEEALLFLRKFNEMGATKEAERLTRAIRGRYQSMYEHYRKEGSLPLRLFNLMAKSKALELVNDLKNAVEQVTGILGDLKHFVDATKEAGEDADHIQLLREEIGAFLSAFASFHHGEYQKRAKKFSELMPKVPKEEWTGQIAHIALAFEQFRDEDEIAEEIEINQHMVEDLEYAIDNFGYLSKDVQYIYAALLENSKRPEVISKLITEVYTTAPAEQLRERNGVDPDISNLHKIINYQEGKGYLDQANTYPGLRPLMGPIWEESLVDRIKLIGFCFGKAWRLKAEGKLEQIGPVLNHISNLLKSFGFSLQERSKWKRSYALPEHIFPYLYSKLTRFYMEFAPEQLEAFIKDICSRSAGQLGLYTEGYRSVLSSIASRLSRSQAHDALTFLVLKDLETHVLGATQNRWERVPLLLEIAEGYAKLGNNQKAEATYQQMLDTSMGPTWYKEDQFSLINTALSLHQVGGENELFEKFGNQLEFAAGELTFQRYVRVAQQGFIGNLAMQGNTAAAIDYYKYQTIPDPQQIIANAVRSRIDALMPGDGYVRGARNINEASGIIQLIKHTKADPVLKWAVTEVFIINNDIYRYINSFAELQGACIKELSSNGPSPELGLLQGRLKACLLDPELESNRHHYLTDLRDELPEAEYERLKSDLGGSGIDFPAPAEPRVERGPEEDAMYDEMNFPGMGKHSNFRALPELLARAKQQLEMENKPAAAKILSEGLVLLHNGKSDIWMGSGIGPEVGELWDQLSEAGTVQEILTLLKEPIASHYTQDWRVIEKLLRVLRNHLDAEQVKTVLSAVKDHLYYMVREPEPVEEFNWILMPLEGQLSNDEQLVELLIWFFDHPYVSVKKRAIQALLAVCEHRPLIVWALWQHILDPDDSVIKEVCANILLRISQLYPQLLVENLQIDQQARETVLNETHFMVRYYLLKMAEKLKAESEAMSALYDSLLAAFPDSVNPGGEVEFDEPFMHLVDSILDPLEDLGMLNGSFCRAFLEHLGELSAPLDIYGQIRAGHYLERSFQDEEEHHRRIVHILRQGINLAILPGVAKDKIEQAAEILKIWFFDEI